MTVYTLYPAFVRLFYHTTQLNHVATLPVVGWNEPVSGHDYGTFDAHDLSSPDADDIVQEYATVIQPIFSEDVTIDSYVIYTMSSPTAKPQPRVGNTVALTGTNTDNTWFKANQVTMSLRTSTFNKSKWTLLDVPVTDVYSKTSALPGSGIYRDWFDIISGLDKPWCGRDRNRPSGFISITTTLNEKLRRAYRFT
jgi:hypothetical protein